MSEIVVAGPANDEQNRASRSGRRANTTTDKRPFTRSPTFGRERVPEPFDSEKLPVTLVSEIQKFLRVANQIEADEPRVAFLCRFHAFEVAHNKDRYSSGRGVRHFKTSLLLRLKQDEEFAMRKRREKSDSREVRRVCQQYKDYIIKHAGEYTLETREKLNRARAIASVLSELLIAYHHSHGLLSEAPPPPLRPPTTSTSFSTKCKHYQLQVRYRVVVKGTTGSSYSTHNSAGCKTCFLVVFLLWVEAEIVFG